MRQLSTYRASGRSLNCGPARTALLFCLFAAGALIAPAQESIRPSETGATASQARRQVESPAAYNVKVGPVGVDVSASVDVEAVDNVGLSENHRQGDLILRPRINFDSEWKLSALNTFRFNVGIGYSEYTQHSNLNTRAVLLDPGSQIAFDIYVGGVLKLNFHDRFSIVQNPIDEPTLSNVARFDRFQNSAGVTGTIDLNDLKIVLGYDHFTYQTLSSQFDTLDRQEEQFFGSAGLLVNDALTVGLDASAALVNYRLNFNNDGTTYSGGPFIEAALSPYSKVRLSGGYQGLQFDNNGTSGDTTNYSGWYANLTAAQRLNQYWSHSLSVGHEARIGLDVNFTEYSYARYQANWRLNTRLDAGFDAFWEDANDSGTAAQSSEHSHRWGGGASLAWKLGNRLGVVLRYRYVKKDSDLDLRSYYQNDGTLTINYDF